MGLQARARVRSSVPAYVVVAALLPLMAGCASPAPGPAPTAASSGQGVEAPAAADATVARGAELYSAHCQACHGDRNGAGRIPAAPLHNQDGHTWHHSDRNLMDTILNGSGEMGDMMRRMMGVPDDAPRMPAWKDKLSEDDVRAILAFIKTWWTPEQLRLQERSPMMR